MFKKRTLSLVLVAVLLASLLAIPSCKKSVETAQGVTKIYQETHINGRLTINQKGTDEILRLQDSGTDVWTVADGGAQSTGSDGAGYDVTWYSTTAGDKAMWDASAVALWITGTNGSTAFDVSDGNVIVNDNFTVTAGNAAVSAGTFDVTAGATTVETTTVGADGVGADVTMHSLTAGDSLLWDSSAVCLDITGTNAQNAFRVLDGNVSINDDLTVVEGNVAISAGTFDMTAGATTVETMTVGADGVGTDVTMHSLTAGDYLLWDASAAALNITGTDAHAALNVSDGDVVVADDLRITGQTAITVTNGAGFSPTGTYQSIQAGSEVTPTINVGAAGDLLVLINISTNVINLADTGIQKLSAAWAGGQYDVLVLWCDGTNWIEISRSDN